MIGLDFVEFLFIALILAKLKRNRGHFECGRRFAGQKTSFEKEKFPPILFVPILRLKNLFCTHIQNLTMTLQCVNHIGISSQWNFGHFIVNVRELKIKKDYGLWIYGYWIYY